MSAIVNRFTVHYRLAHILEVTAHYQTVCAT
jgi:hypothetical protein